ncbi:hypothetical protein OOK41_14455 [Micromonospora sp. NBC_01655]|uniref:hypothetical protein n=1 Tax=Micromonospora sp. NBC_01655 TaxID=2975983 RepID=UPI00225767B2|nr:hypothetical protein [Micromonospora sp. NBC_01655]MCX4471492.1 hypothetical protein [Micromonospora sp. NBC_01655]
MLALYVGQLDMVTMFGADTRRAYTPESADASPGSPYFYRPIAAFRRTPIALPVKIGCLDLPQTAPRGSGDPKAAFGQF